MFGTTDQAGELEAPCMLTTNEINKKMKFCLGHFIARYNYEGKGEKAGALISIITNSGVKLKHF
jgi:hypothetical protein